MFLFDMAIASLLAVSASDTAIRIADVDITASFKAKSNLQVMPLASSSFFMKDIERQQIGSIADFAGVTPNLHIPDYGSKMTSSIYVRGIGSRIDNPAVGMYVDQIPYLNKNSFDESLWDIRRIDVLRGPQATLYGRNTIGGIIGMTTLSPLNYNGTRISLEYGNGNSLRTSASTYQDANGNFAFSIGISGQHTDGFFTNEHTGDRCDWQNGLAGRVRLVWRNLSGWQVDNTFSIDFSDEGGYAYAQYDTVARKTLPVAYNDECGYTRTHLVDGIVAQRTVGNVQMQNVLSYQYLDDDMRLDQDFTVKSMFTLQQKQSEHIVTEEITFRNQNQRLNWIGGFSTFFKHNRMSAPVTFKSDGISELILDNANAGIQTAFPDASILFAEDEFAINSHFTTPVLGLAVYGQAEMPFFSNFTLTAGLRLDYEHIGFEYRNSADINYRFTLTMDKFKPMRTEMKGTENVCFLEVLPKLSLQYAVNGQSIYLTASRGFKSGGYNTQMFSDILQSKMKTDLMGSLGVYFDDGIALTTVDDVVSYKPEHDWNYELGSHLSLFNKRLNADMALFYIDCRDQQLTVFPSGKSTGRMMTNAGRTRSYGAEVSARASLSQIFHVEASYGYTNATFIDYDNGVADYSGNRLPYVPEHTVSASASANFKIDSRFANNVSMQVGYIGAGKIYWNEANSVSQDYYSQLSASVGAGGSKWGLRLWAKNLTNTEYCNFHFVSVGNTFLSKGKPMRFGLTLNLYL